MINIATCYCGWSIYGEFSGAWQDFSSAQTASHRHHIGMVFHYCGLADALQGVPFV